MRKPIVMMIALLAFSFAVKAQSLEEGIKMYKYERYTTAKQILTPMAAGNAAANYYLGLSELGLENVSAAMEAFRKFPDDAANVAGQARVAFLNKDVTGGMTLANVAAGKAKKKEWEPLKYAADAITYTKGGDIQQAITWYKAALAKNDNAEIRIALGDAYRLTSIGGGEAMTNWENVTGKDAKNSYAWTRQGSLWYGAKRYDLALEAYQKAKDADLDNPIPYGDLARVYFWSGKFDLAKQNIEEYLKRSDKTCKDQVQHANLVYLTKDYQGAIKEMQGVLGLCGDKPYPYRIIAASQVEMGDSLAALQSINTYFSKQNADDITPFDYKTKGKIYLKLRQFDSSDYYYNLFTKADTLDRLQKYKDIAEDFKAQRNDTAYAKAGYWYGRIAQENTAPSATDYYNWGLYMYYGKKYEEAGKAFEIMEAKYPEQPSAPYWRGRVKAATDPEAKTCIAKEHFVKWLAIPATDKYTQRASDKIIAYQYLLICAYNSDDKEGINTNMGELEKLDPNDKVLKQIKDIQASKNKPAPAPKPKPKGK